VAWWRTTPPPPRPGPPPPPTAAAIAIVFRLLTFYLPPIWGGFAMRWLRRQAYL